MSTVCGTRHTARLDELDVLAIRVSWSRAYKHPAFPGLGVDA